MSYFCLTDNLCLGTSPGDFLPARPGMSLQLKRKDNNDDKGTSLLKLVFDEREGKIVTANGLAIGRLVGNELGIVSFDDPSSAMWTRPFVSRDGRCAVAVVCDVRPSDTCDPEVKTAIRTLREAKPGAYVRLFGCNGTNDEVKTYLRLPFDVPSRAPSASPSYAPTYAPSVTRRVPSKRPSAVPTGVPTGVPTRVPTRVPTNGFRNYTSRPSFPTVSPSASPEMQLVITNELSKGTEDRDSLYATLGVLCVFLTICIAMFYRKK